jgi:putative holliday junction resolvase
MKYLGIDYGTKRIGIAISDDAGEFAFPKGIVKTDVAVQDIVRICDEENVKEIVIGESIASNEQENEVQSAVRQFGKRLTDVTGRSVSFEREDFSSVEAHRYQTYA